MCQKVPLTQPSITPVSDREYELDTTYLCSFYRDKKKKWHIELTIKPGFIYDGASVPRIFWSLSGLRPDGLHRAASLVHDYLYVKKGKLSGFETRLCTGDHWNRVSRVELSRKNTDRIFLDMMFEAGMSKFKARMACYSVRAAGWVLWNRKPKLA
ncbi:MAG: DUF1353 domain-containing protein [Bacteroidetes bacterium]|nr:MAG: DUF1353 domain-containing protein [Bacteroidota bacterium]